MENFIILYENFYKQILIMIFFSFLIRQTLNFIGQSWVTTIAQTSSIFLLPIITFFITSVIAGNIALSLGMVGALSIVRFRNPVRSPLELVTYFLCIAIGIASYVNIKIAVGLVLSSILIFLILSTFNYLCIKLYKKSFFNSSFNEANLKYTLEISSKSEIEELIRKPQTWSSNFFNGVYTYILISEDKNLILDLFNQYKNDKNITNINFNS